MPEQPPARANPISRRQVLRHLLVEALDDSLPSPQSIRFNEDNDGPLVSLSFGTDGEKAVRAWSAALGLPDGELRCQPYPLDPEHKQWTTNAGCFGGWHGWDVALHGSDPFTDDHARQWEESGGAERRRKYLAQQAQGPPMADCDGCRCCPAGACDPGEPRGPGVCGDDCPCHPDYPDAGKAT